MDGTPTRRALLGALAATPLIAIPAFGVPTGTTPFAVVHARYIATRETLNRLPESVELDHPATFEALETRYTDAVDALDHATPTTWAEFVQKLEFSIADGCAPGADLCNQLIAEAKQLLKGVN